MRILLKLLLGLAATVAILIALLYLTGNGHIVRGVRYTYLIGRSGPEIDDRNFFPYATIPADHPQPWPRSARYGHLKLDNEQVAALNKLNTVGFVVVKNDSLLFEDYFDGWRADSVSNSFSVAKSYISLLTGIAMQEGRIKDLKTPVGLYLPAFDQVDSCHKPITLWHLLTMSTGLDWSESGSSPFSDNAKGYYGTNVSELAMEQPCRVEPGKEFDYISGSTQIMSDVLQEVYGRPLNELVQEKIWKPLGAEHTAYWGKDREDGDFKAFCCLYATARDFARIGQLWLDSGKWHGHRMVPTDYWRASITPAPLMDQGVPNERYGFFWWLASVDGMPMYYCRGFHGEYVVVIPKERLVMVRTGAKWEEKNDKGHPKDVFQWVAIARALAASAG
ncbi:MAG: serine hydrolase [Flavobacteriales bacterium]|nr:serine hydrolase [Flavobacteriales bacterium]MBP9080816.1 serine hydrolase [Flavobacteriales bacterium]